MNKSGTAPQTIHLEQLEPRYLLSSMPLVQNQAHILDLSSQNRVGSLVGYPPPSYAPSQRTENKSIVEGYLPGSSVLAESKGRTGDRDDPDDDDDDDHGPDRDDLPPAAMPAQLPPQSAFVSARTLGNGNPSVAGDQDAGLLASGGPNAFGRIAMESSVDTAFPILTRATGSRLTNSATNLDLQIAGSLEPSPNLTGAPKPSEAPNPQPRALPSASATGADRWDARLVNVLGDLSPVDAGILEKSIRQFLDRIQDAIGAARGEDGEESIMPWIAAAAVAGLACEIGRRQMRRSAGSAHREDNINGIRDVLFLNLDRVHE